MVDTGILFNNMKSPSHECQMTFWPLTSYSATPTIRLSINFMTFIPSLTLTELRVVSIERLQRVWHDSRERLPFRTPGSVPLFWTFLCSNSWDLFSRTCRVFLDFFTLDTPRYCLDFACKILYHLYSWLHDRSSSVSTECTNDDTWLKLPWCCVRCYTCK